MSEKRVVYYDKHKLGYDYIDGTPCTIFPSKCAKRSLDWDIMNLNPDNLAVEGSVKNITNDKEDEMLTRYLRSIYEQQGYRNRANARLRNCIIPSYKTREALMLPLDNKLGLGYLTFRSPLYIKMVCEVIRKAYRANASEEELEGFSQWLVDMSFSFPYGPQMIHSGQLAVNTNLYDSSRMNYFANKLYEHLTLAFVDAQENLVDFLPPKNVTKGLGFDTLDPVTGVDTTKGEEKKKYSWAPSSLYSTYPGNIVRHYNGVLRDKWLSSGVTMRNFKYLLENCDRLTNIKVFDKLYEYTAMAISVYGYRTNCPDLPILGEDFDYNKPESCLGKLYAKDRDYDFEVSPGVYHYGTADIKKFNSVVRGIEPWRLLCSNRIREINNINNMSHSLPFQLLFRMIYKKVEECPAGMPSQNADILLRYKNFIDYAKLNGFDLCIISYDRKTSEQFITDNWDTLTSIYKGWLKKVINIVGLQIMSSSYGPRVVNGALASGMPATSFLNSTVGIFETINFLTDFCMHFNIHTNYTRICDDVFKSLFEDYSHIVLDDNNLVLYNLGTDDQIFYFASKSIDESEIRRFADKYSEGRSLKFEVGKKQTVFGILFTTEKAEFSPSVAISKMFYDEHNANGDRTALKYYSHFNYNAKWYDLIQSVFTDLGFGNIDTYAEGKNNFYKNLATFGFPVEGMFNEFSLKEQLTIGSELQKFYDQFGKNKLTGEDIRFESKKYSIEQMQPFADVWKAFIYKDANLQF